MDAAAEQGQVVAGRAAVAMAGGAAVVTVWAAVAVVAERVQAALA